MAAFQNSQSYSITQARYIANGLPDYPSQEAHQEELEWDSERLSHLTQRLLEEKRVWQRGTSTEPPATLEAILLNIYKILSMIRACLRNPTRPPPEYLLEHWAGNIDLFEQLAEICPSLPPNQQDTTSTSSSSIDNLIGTTGDLCRALLRVFQSYRTEAGRQLESQ